MPSAAPPRDAPPAVATSAASVTPHRVALALLLRLLAGPSHSAEPGLADELRARAAPPSPPPCRVRQRLALFLLRETRAVNSWHEPSLSALLLRLAAEVKEGRGGGEAEAGKGGHGKRGERGRNAEAEGAEEGEEGWGDVGGVLVQQLQALQSPDDLFSLFASLHCEWGTRVWCGAQHVPSAPPGSILRRLKTHACPVPRPTSPPHDRVAACVARSTSPPRHRAAAAASPACQPVTRGSALGLFLRSLLLSFHHLPFQ
ncbi:unnamed protein product, partial [Closterium sp. Naga37s-1]